MKRLFMTFAAMLLMSVGAFAQSISISKCDVNEDNVVDIADITAIINVMKYGGGTFTLNAFYLGTTHPTADNFQTLPGMVSSYTSIDEAIGTVASIEVGQTLYMLCPTAWMKGKCVALEDNSGNTFDFLDDKDDTTISEYLIYRTPVWNDAANVTLKLKNNYYIGLTNASKTEWSLSDLNSYSATAPETFTLPAATDGNPLDIIVYPEEWGDATQSRTAISGIEGYAWLSAPWITSLPKGYKAAFMVAESTPVHVKMIQWNQ